MLGVLEKGRLVEVVGFGDVARLFPETEGGDNDFGSCSRILQPRL